VRQQAAEVVSNGRILVGAGPSPSACGHHLRDVVALLSCHGQAAFMVVAKTIARERSVHALAAGCPIRYIRARSPVVTTACRTRWQ
jgi:hypothetical protein